MRRIRIMSAIIVKSNLCPQNHKCPAVLSCPALALKQEGFNAPTIDYTKCRKCGRCTTICPKGALSLSID